MGTDTPQSTPPAGHTEERSVARRAGTVGAATMLSRVLGLVREQVMAGFFGAGLAADAFNVAFRIPNLLRDLFAEGAMSSAFVPSFTAVQHQRGEAAAWAFGRQLIATLVVVLGLVCVAGWFAAPWIVAAFAPGFAAVPGKLELTVLLTRVMLPFLPTLSVAAVCMGMLNARGRFGVPALAPSLLNLGMITFGLALIPVCTSSGQPAILAMALGVVIGGGLQLAIQLPSLHALGFRFRLERPRGTPEVRRVGWLMLPATVGLAATQLNVLFSTIIASLLVQGSVSWLGYAFRLMQLPIGVFGVALATVSLPALSRAAVAGDLRALTGTLSATVRLVLVLTVPAALWLAAMAPALVALLYQHGHFGAADTEQTASALVMYCIGLPAFAAVGVFTRAFYALGDTRRPVQASLVSVAVNVTLNLALMNVLGHSGLALATSVTSILNAAQLAFYLRRTVGSIDARRILTTGAQSLLAGGVAAAACAVGLDLAGAWARSGLVAEGIVVAAGLVVGGLITWGTMRALKVSELASLEDLARGLLARVGLRR